MARGPLGGNWQRREREGRVFYEAEITIAHARRSKSFGRKTDCLAWLRKQGLEKLRVEEGLEDPAHPDERTLRYVDLKAPLLAYWSAGVDRVRTDETLAGYKRQLALLLNTWGERLVVLTRPRDVTAYAAELRAQGKSTSTISNRLDMLAWLHRIAVLEGLIRRAPCAVERPRVIASSEVAAVSETDYARLVRAARGLEDARALAVILLAGDAGLREAEIARLRGQDLDLTGWDGSAYGSVHVAVRGERDRTKSGRARTVPILTADLLDALRPLFPARGVPVIRKVRRRKGESFELRPLRIHRIALDAWTAAREAPRPKDRPSRSDHRPLHDLRHRFGSWQAERGVAPKTLMEWMGHADIRTTLRYWSRKTSGVPAGAAVAPEHGTGFSPDSAPGRKPDPGDGARAKL